MSPIEANITTIADNIRLAEEVNAGELVEMLGGASYPMVILVLSVLNMLPGPPGYGGTLAIAIMSASGAMILDKPLRLGGWIGRRQLPEKLLGRMVSLMLWLAGIVGRISRPRLQMLTGPRMEVPTGIFILMVSLPMIIPIPLINAVPNAGIAIICVSRLNRDGLGVMLGWVVAAVGLAIAVGTVWVAIVLARSVIGA